MTIHKLIGPGRRRTVCALNVPDFIGLKPAEVEWNDGDEINGLCPDGCYQLVADVYVAAQREHTRALQREIREEASEAPKPSAPRPNLQRFEAMANKPQVPNTPRDRTQVKIGDAVSNRDGSVVVHLTSNPIDGRIFLVPVKP